MAGKQMTHRPRGLAPLLRRNPFFGISNLEDLLERFWDEDGSGIFGGLLAPLDLKETEKEIRVRVDLPGVDPKEIDIQIVGNQLLISGERKEEKEEKGDTFHRVERQSGRFSRSVALPCAVDEPKIDATYKDGVLTVSLPKAAEAKGHRIKVKT